MAQICDLAAARKWDTITEIAQSQDWPDSPDSLPILLGMVWAIQWTHPQGTKFLTAIHYLERAYRCQPDDEMLIQLQLTEAALRAEAGDIIKAVEILKTEPLASTPRYRWHVHQNVAMCYRHMSEWDLALSHFDKALEATGGIDRRYWQSRLDQALTLVEADRISQAAEVWETIRSPEPYAGMYHLLGTEVHTEIGHFREALCQGVLALQHLRATNRVETGLAVAEYTARAYLAMARAHRGMGEAEKALRYCRAVSELAGCPPFLLCKADQLGRAIIHRKEESSHANPDRVDCADRMH